MPTVAVVAAVHPSPSLTGPQLLDGGASPSFLLH